MDRRDFLQLVLPPEGPWFVGFAAKKNPGVEPTRRQQSFQSIEKLDAWLTYFDKQEFEVYYACASFNEARVWDAQHQRYRFRTHENVNKLRDLFADIDTRESKPNAFYADCAEAAAAVIAFCRDAGLPRPVWVGSGGGLHVHWPFDPPLVRLEWQPYARGLKALAEKYGLKIDPARTADASSVLRPPGALHRGTGRIVQASEKIEPYDLKLFDHLKEHGREKDSGSGRVRTSERAHIPGPGTSAILGGLGFDASDPGIIRHYCAQIREFEMVPGQYSEPFHYRFAGLAHYCGPAGIEWIDRVIGAEWRAAAHAKRNQWAAAANAPPSCQSIRGVSPRPELCDTCPWFKKESNPAQLGRHASAYLDKFFAKVPETVQVQTPARSPIEFTEQINGFPALAAPWALSDQNQLVFRVEDKDGNFDDTLVSAYPIYIDGMHVSEATERASYSFKHHRPLEGWATINVPAEDMKNGRGVPELVAKSALIYNDKLFGQYMMEQLDTFGHKHKQETRYEQCGWKKDDTEFLVGTKLYIPGPVCREVVTNDGLWTRAKLGLGPNPGGDARVFTSLLNQLFRPDHHVAWFNLLASYGAIFQRWHSSTEGGIIVSNYTPESGTGKTKIIVTAAAIWGLWNALSLKHYDTSASQGLILAELANLPGFIDEFAHFAKDPQYGPLRLQNFLDVLAAGTDKHRALNSGVGIRPQLGRWQLVCLTTSNRPIVEIISNVTGSELAPIRRLFEGDAHPPADFDPMVGEHLEKLIFKNAGWAGDAFLRHLMTGTNLDYAKQALTDTTTKLWKTTELPTEHRFRIGLLADIQLAYDVGTDCGLVPREVPIDEVLGWGLEQIRTRTPSDPKETTLAMGLDVLHEFMTANANNTLRVQNAYKSGQMQLVLGQKPQKVVIRQEHATGRLFASVAAFKKFIISAGYPYADIVKQLLSHGIMRDDKRWMTLGAGTEYASMQVPCIEINLMHPAVNLVPMEVANGNERVAGR